MNQIDYLLEIESKYNLLEDRIEGFAYWVYNRRDIMWDIMSRKNHYGKAHASGNISLKQKFALRMGMIRNAVLRDRVNVKNAEILVMNHERRVFDGTVYECIYTDEVASQFRKAVVMERPYQQTHLRPVSTKNLFYTDRMEIGATVGLLFHKKITRKHYRQIYEQVYHRIEDACRELCDRLGVECDLVRYVTIITDSYFIYREKKKAIAGIVKRYNPKAILEVVSYNFDCMIMNEVTAPLQIPTIELQHGTTGVEHLAYNYPAGVSIEQFPKYYFAFSQFWCEETRYPIPMQRRKIVGFPHLEKMIGKVDKEKKPGNDLRKAVLFISQGPVGKIMSRMALELNSLLDKEQYQIIYKLHPGEYRIWREEYPYLEGTDIEVVDNNEKNLYDYFAISNYQVGGYGSTATFEGLYFDLKTYIYEPGANSCLQALWEKGYAEKFNSVEELYQLIIEDVGSRAKAECFWTTNALDNIVREIGNAIEECRGNGH